MNIRPANILLYNCGGQHMNVKLADHGEFTHHDSPDADLLTKPAECLIGNAYTAKGDIW